MNEMEPVEKSLLENQEDNPVGAVKQMMNRMTAAASVDAVYQEPIQHGDTLIIPSAEVVAMMGFGVGGGERNENQQESGGGGGGGSVFSRPVAVIISTPEGVRVDPIFDLTKVALAGMTTGAIILGTLFKMIGLRQKIQEAEDEIIRTR